MMATRKQRLRVTVRFALSLALLVGIASLAPLLSAEEAPRPVVAASSLDGRAPVYKPARPYWLELTPAQRQALMPLADDWERLDFQTKKKWVEIGNRYPRMSEDEQGRTQQRMREWAMLTPEQRRVARDSFARVRSMNPEQRADLLRKYQELPPEKKSELVIEGRANKALVTPKQMPVPVVVPQVRRGQIREGAKTRNPALAAQKGASALVAPARQRVVPDAHPPAPVAP